MSGACEDCDCDNSALKMIKIQAKGFHVLCPELAKLEFPGVIPGSKRNGVIYSDSSLKDFPDNFCGAGEGFGEKIVPDYIGFSWAGGVKISPACWVHDKEWALCGPTWEEFHASNSRFAMNITRIVRDDCKISFWASLLNYRAMTYFNAVSTFGKKIFWTLKVEQGYVIPENAKSLIDWDEIDPEQRVKNGK